MSAAPLWADALGLALAGLGALLSVAGAIGLMRLSDRQMRVRALAAPLGLGGTLTLVGLAFSSWDGALAARLLLFAAMLAALAPGALYALAHALHAEPDERS